MSKGIVRPGETLTIMFEGDDGIGVDGEFEVMFDNPKCGCKGQLVVKESGGFPGSVKGGANEVLFHEDFRDLPEDKKAK